MTRSQLLKLIAKVNRIKTYKAVWVGSGWDGVQFWVGKGQHDYVQLLFYCHQLILEKIELEIRQQIIGMISHDAVDMQL